MAFITIIHTIYEQYKGLIIAFIIIAILRLISSGTKQSTTDSDASVLEFRNLSPEEQKLFLVTQFNTNINREMIPQPEAYMKKFYSQIYGKDTNTMYSIQKQSHSFASISPKKKGGKVKFMDRVEISRH